MDFKFLFSSILLTVEIFFASTTGMLFAYTFFRTHKVAQKEYNESKIGSVSFGPAYEVYEENGKYYVADIMKHNNPKEISKKDYLQYQKYKEFDYGLEMSSIQVKKDRILTIFAIIFTFVSSFISIKKIIHSIQYSIIIDFIYLIIGFVIVLTIKALVDRINVKVPSIPESIQAYEKEYYEFTEL